ncbi:hypothetical protein ETD86_36345 [Nonomuraea turkmeniaca]|uniref:Uncharacterized protein n=1 Tax=Nonomuraea turkmeniaca TaxID=103838 RepID=A0A5S4F4Z9_9ACTN|nr:hypothetical protein [Nonomuraea turkmeniaca]TMR11257.1 hypothetical protein ETD86_36345 [Nonomuraea turkmeniaca]
MKPAAQHGLLCERVDDLCPVAGGQEQDVGPGLPGLPDQRHEVGVERFEGSFHFNDLLTSDIAHLVYGVCASGSPVELALEAEKRAGERWREVLRRHADALAT